MLAIGRALVSEPKVILLDEPSLGLAPQIVENIFNIVQTSSVRTGVNVDAAGNVISPLVFGTTASTLTSLPTDGNDFLALNGYEQRKFQLGFKFSF